MSEEAPTSTDFPFYDPLGSMLARRSQFKSIAIRRPPTNRSGRFKRSLSRRRRVGAAASGGGDKPFNDPTVTILNRFKPPPAIFKRTVMSAFVLSASTGGGYTMIFDPSGTYSLYQGSATGAISAMPDWTSLSNLYNQYKVRKVKVTWKALVTSTVLPSLDDSSCSMLHRYNYEKGVVNPTVAGVAQTAGLIRKVFTSQHPSTTYVIYPKCMRTLENTGLLAAQGQAPEPHEWTNVGSPCELFGYQFVFENGTNNSTQLYADVEYEVAFRYNK